MTFIVWLYDIFGIKKVQGHSIILYNIYIKYIFGAHTLVYERIAQEKGWNFE